MVFFFFKQKTAYELRISDWSSDVCSSDLGAGKGARPVGLDRVEGPRGGKCLDLAAVEQFRVDAAREIVEAREIAARTPFGDECFTRFLAEALECAERVAPREAFIGMAHREIGLPPVPRRRAERDFEPPHIVDRL